MPYWQLYYHATWSTKYRQPLLTPDVEPVIHNYLRIKAIGLGARVYALNGVADHVHLVAAIPPGIAVAKFIGQVKGMASTRFNKSGRSSTPFLWQEEYGVFSFDAKRLPYVIIYVERQKEHHAQSSLIPLLERNTDESFHELQESPATYFTGYETWHREMSLLS